MNELNTHASKSPTSTYEAEQYPVIASDFVKHFGIATDAVSASAEYAGIGELIATIDSLKSAIVLRQSALSQKANDEAVIEKMKQQIANGVNLDDLFATLVAHRTAYTKSAAGTSKRPPFPKAPKVYEYLAVPDHNDYTQGYTQSLRGLTVATHPWAKKLPDGSADPAYFRLSNDTERAEMQNRRDAYIHNDKAKQAIRAANKAAV